jgi:hypothetical protein
MICPYCFELSDPAPAIFGERGEPCSPPHCIKPSCCADCPECSSWFEAIEPEEGKVEHPKAKLAPEESTKGQVRNSPVVGRDKPPGPPTKSAREVAPAAARYNYRPTDDEAAIAETIAKRRNTLNRNQTNIPGGETANKEERYKQHYRAVLAEIAVARIFNQSWTGCGKGSDGLPDVGGKIEVRSIDSRSKNLLVRKKDADRPMALVLVSENRNCEVLGWEYASIVREKGRILGEGTEKEAYLLGVNELRDPKELYSVLEVKPSVNTPPESVVAPPKPKPLIERDDIPW